MPTTDVPVLASRGTMLVDRAAPLKPRVARVVEAEHRVRLRLAHL
jgi:hypothetical protein